MEQPALDLPAQPGGRRFVVDLPELIGEIAKRHGVRIRRDDPALMVLTAFELVVKQLTAEVQHTITNANDDVSAKMAQHLETSQAVASAHVDAAAGFLSERLKAEIPGLASALGADTRKLLESLGREICQTRERTFWAYRTAVAAATVSVSCAVVMVVALLRLPI